MPIPVQTRLFQPFLGDQEGVGARLLTDAYSPDGSQNIWINELGKIQKIGGSVQVGAVAAASTRVGNLYLYKYGGGTDRFLIGAIIDGSSNTDLYYDTATLWDTTTAVTWNPLSGFSSGAYGILDFAQMGDTIIVTASGLTTQAISGSVPISANAGATQIAAPTFGAQAAGNLIGNYRWRVLPVIGQTRKVASVASATQILATENQVVNWTADADTNVTGYELYRTTGTGISYYYVTHIEGRTTVTYTDNITDATILGNRVLIEHGDAPPSCNFCESHKQRMWYGKRNDGTGPRKIYYSDPGDADSVYADTSFFDLTDEKSYGDAITGMTGEYDGKMVVWMNESVWTIGGTGQNIGLVQDWTRKRSNATVGSVHHRTVIRVPTGAKYTDPSGILRETSKTTLAYLTPHSDIRLFDGDSDVIISWPKRDALETAEDASLATSHAFHDTKRGLIIWYLPGPASLTPNFAVAWNYKIGTWHEFSDQSFESVIKVDGTNENYVIIGGHSQGRTFRLYESLTRDGAAFSSILQFQPLFLGDGGDEPDFSLVKRYRWMDLLFTYTATPNTGSCQYYEAILSPSQVSGATPDLIHATVSTSLRSRVPLKKTTSTLEGRYLHSRGLSFRFAEQDDNCLWELEGIRVGYQALAGQKREQ